MGTVSRRGFCHKLMAHAIRGHIGDVVRRLKHGAPGIYDMVRLDRRESCLVLLVPRREDKQQAARELMHLAELGPGHRALLSALGGPAAVVDLARSEDEVARCLMTFSVYLDLQPALIASGGIAEFVFLARSGSGTAKLCSSIALYFLAAHHGPSIANISDGARGLADLALASSGQTEEFAALALGRLGAIASEQLRYLVMGLGFSKFLNENREIKKFAAVLAIVAREDAARKAICDVGGIAMLVGVERSGDVTAKMSATAALTKLAQNDDDIHASIEVARGGVRALFRSASAHGPRFHRSMHTITSRRSRSTPDDIVIRQGGSVGAARILARHRNAYASIIHKCLGAAVPKDVESGVMAFLTAY